MYKFENVDIMKSLSEIMKQNTGFYQTDIEIDRKQIEEAAASTKKEDKTLLWISRPSGTHCLREYDVYVEGSAANSIWRFYKEQTSDRILAYAVELSGEDCGVIKGDLYELDYEEKYRHVKEKALPSSTRRMIYKYGAREEDITKYFSFSPDPEYGMLERYELLPDDSDALQILLQEEKDKRAQLKQGDFGMHINALHKGLIQHEAQDIIRRIKKSYEWNIGDLPYCMTEVSPVFLQLTSAKDMRRLLSMIPYKSCVLCAEPELSGMYAKIDKTEVEEGVL